MRLTTNLRKAIVSAVMADIPKTDFFEKEHEIRLAAVIRQMPEKVRAVYEDPALREYLQENTCETILRKPKGGHRYPFFCGLVGNIKLTAAEQKKIEGLQPAFNAQHERLESARAMLVSAMAGFSTVKQAREAMPELEKYLPKEQEKIAMLPAVAGVVESLVAAGWKR